MYDRQVRDDCEFGAGILQNHADRPVFPILPVGLTRINHDLSPGD